MSRYIANPLLINGHKFDLRIYVAVTCFDPLRVYGYKEGLARFASEPYSSTRGNKYSHLTNYSINKKNNNYVQGSDDQDDSGFKWSLHALCRHLESAGIDTELLWKRIYDVIIKAIIAGENHILNGVRKYCTHRSNCYELYGFDIIIDSDLKPWLLEINLSPSLTSDSTLDHKIKSNLISDMFNLIGVRRFDRRV